MVNLLLVFDKYSPSVALTQKGFKNLSIGSGFAVETKQLLSVTKTDIDGAQVVMFIRPDNLYSAKIARRANESGAVTVTLCDDDLLNLDKANHPLIPWRKRGLVNTLGESDVIISSNRYILEKYRTLTSGKRTAQYDTVVCEEDFAPVGRSNEVVKIVYAAGSSHVKLFDKYVKQAFEKIAEEYRKKISITFVGLNPELDGLEEKTTIVYKPGMPLSEYRSYMANERFDIGLAPLDSDDFSKCKYFNKYLEYTISGVFGLYSNTEPYTFVVQNEKNGLLVDNNKWYEALKRGIDDEALRKNAVEAAREQIRQNHNKDTIVLQLKHDIPELFYSDSKRIACKSFKWLKIEYYFFKLLDYVFLCGYYFLRGGLKNLAGRIIIHFKDRRVNKMA